MIVNFYFFAKIACIIVNKITLLILLFIFLSQDMVSQTGDSPDSLHGQTAREHRKPAATGRGSAKETEADQRGN